MLTAERLRELLHYDPLTGIFTWCVRRGANRRGGKQAGSVSREGYRSIKVEDKLYKAHRLAWLHVHGVWPVDMLDHINGERDDNRIGNLRQIGNTENQQNRRRARVDSAAQLLGVKAEWRHWRADIRVNGKRHYLGSFDTPEAAHEAYVKAKRVLHPGGTL